MPNHCLYSTREWSGEEFQPWLITTRSVIPAPGISVSSAARAAVSTLPDRSNWISQVGQVVRSAIGNPS